MNTDRNRAKDLETIAILACACLLLFWLSAHKWLLLLALVLLSGAAFSGSFASAVSNGWLRFGKAVGGVSNRVILSLVFYIFLTPLAVLYRLFHKNPLSLNKQPGERSYFVNREHSFSAQDLRDPW